MGGKAKLDYSKIDPWIKKNPEAQQYDFVKANPKIAISGWTYRKRRAKILNLAVCPSMRDDYRGNKGGKVEHRRTQSVYTTLYARPIKELKEMDGVAGANEIIVVVNRLLKLNLESAQIEVIGSGVQNFELRRYSR